MLTIHYALIYVTLTR